MAEQEGAAATGALGDPAVVSVWRGELLRYVHRLTGDRDVAEDVAQEALVRLLTADAAVMHNPRAWLYRVATNLVRDRGRRTEMMRRKALPVETDTPADPEQELERKQTIAQVRAALDQLKPRDRELLTLRESGFRYREIAEVMGVKTESVPMLALRALRRLRAAYLAEVGHEAS